MKTNGSIQTTRADFTNTGQTVCWSAVGANLSLLCPASRVPAQGSGTQADRRTVKPYQRHHPRQHGLPDPLFPSMTLLASACDRDGRGGQERQGHRRTVLIRWYTVGVCYSPPRRSTTDVIAVIAKPVALTTTASIIASTAGAAEGAGAGPGRTRQ